MFEVGQKRNQESRKEEKEGRLCYHGRLCRNYIENKCKEFSYVTMPLVNNRKISSELQKVIKKI